MSLQVRDGNFDVVIAAGPRVVAWPSVGVRALSTVCAEVGLRVGVFGGDQMTVRGLIPSPGTGGTVVVQDVQGRLHRIEARSVVRVGARQEIPDPFPGWRSQGLIPLSTAERLLKSSHISWERCVAILGTGNRSLRFASRLLELGVDEVFAVETYARWGGKRFAGWEVERRRFEMAGGKLIEAKPLSLTTKGALQWELRLQDAQGVRVLEVARVVSGGPFGPSQEIREHPPGSFLFELEQSAPAEREQDVLGWVLEEERGKFLGARIARSLVRDLGDEREKLDATYRRARGRIRRYLSDRDRPYTPVYQGKWLSGSDARQLREFKGTPQKAHQTRMVAALECFEDIPCNVCQNSCPENAIEIGRVPRFSPSGQGPSDRLLSESRCTGCGICVAACPSGATLMLQEKEGRSVSNVVLPWRGLRPWEVGEFATLLNRRGESLGTGRVVSLPQLPQGVTSEDVQLVELEVPVHVLWDARGLKRMRGTPSEDEAYLDSVARSSEDEKKVEVTLDGERRLARDGVPITVALFEMGQARAEDTLFCPDGSCGQCQVEVDGIKKLACRTEIHRGMALKRRPLDPDPAMLESFCSCLGISMESIQERLAQGVLDSPEAVLSFCGIGEGKCHGSLCSEPFRRLMDQEDLDAESWIDWRFPWSDWVLKKG